MKNFGPQKNFWTGYSIELIFRTSSRPVVLNVFTPAARQKNAIKFYGPATYNHK